MGNYTIAMKVVNSKEAQCNYMTYIVTYRSNILYIEERYPLDATIYLLL